jgi:hypothetical protein
MILHYMDVQCGSGRLACLLNNSTILAFLVAILFMFSSYHAKGPNKTQLYRPAPGVNSICQ